MINTLPALPATIDNANAPRIAQLTGQAQFTGEFIFTKPVGWNLAAGGKNTDRNRQVKMTSRLGQIGRRQIYRDAPVRVFKSGDCQRGANPIAGFAHFCFCQPHDIAGRQAVGKMNFDCNRTRCKSVKRARDCTMASVILISGGLRLNGLQTPATKFDSKNLKVFNNQILIKNITPELAG